MSKDTISVNMNVYDIPILVEQLKKLEKENKQLKKHHISVRPYTNDEVREKIDNYKDTIKQLQQENKQLKEKIDKAIEYINTTDKWLCRVNDNLCVETIGKDKLLEILGDKEND